MSVLIVRCGEKRIVPLRVLPVRLKIEFLHLLVADLHPSLIAPLVQYGFDA